MCWGFSCGDGWEPLIRELSEKLEPIIQKFVDENKPLKCYQCGCKEVMHTDQGCMNIHLLPYQVSWGYRGGPYPYWKHNKWGWVKSRIKFKVWLPINRLLGGWVSSLLNVLHKHYGLTKRKPCHCRKYKANHPCASQVKEKLGGLRFYMTHSSVEIEKHIDEAEAKSYKTCEECGQDGELRNDAGWLTTLCETHAISRRTGKRIPTSEEIEKMTDEEYDAWANPPEEEENV